ncbi:nuclear transport factor 2 family protein [Flavobacterium sp. LB1P62]|uniref:nuclear transport factor 2 family protein n=1 Tax=Flavobacterium sp. LB1P62 TaxID=3401715 RepID=UPI003AAE7925
MKFLIKLISIMCAMSTPTIFAQSGAEKEILNLSLEKFRWKTEGDFDAIENLFDDELVFVHITGHITTKKDWMNQLRNGSFVYNKIEQKEASVKVYRDTAVLVGKAKFTINGGSLYHLVYTEVYTKKNDKWKLVNLHTTAGY